MTKIENLQINAPKYWYFVSLLWKLRLFENFDELDINFTLRNSINYNSHDYRHWLMQENRPWKGFSVIYFNWDLIEAVQLVNDWFDFLLMSFIAIDYTFPLSSNSPFILLYSNVMYIFSSLQNPFKRLKICIGYYAFIFVVSFL